MERDSESQTESQEVNKNTTRLSKVQHVAEFTTFRLFPVGDPHRADTVGLSGKVFEVDHHPFPHLGHNHRALNT